MKILEKAPLAPFLLKIHPGFLTPFLNQAISVRSKTGANSTDIAWLSAQAIHAQTW